MHLYLLVIEFEEPISTSAESVVKYEKLIDTHFLSMGDVKVHPRGWSMEVTLQGNDGVNAEALEEIRKPTDDFMPKIRNMYFPFRFPLTQGDSFKKSAEMCRKRAT